MGFGDSIEERKQNISVTPHCVSQMGPSETAWDQRSKPEFTKEQNGIYYVTLKAQRGASA